MLSNAQGQRESGLLSMGPASPPLPSSSHNFCLAPYRLHWVLSQGPENTSYFSLPGNLCSQISAGLPCSLSLGPQLKGHLMQKGLPYLSYLKHLPLTCLPPPPRTSITSPVFSFTHFSLAEVLSPYFFICFHTVCFYHWTLSPASQDLAGLDHFLCILRAGSGTGHKEEIQQTLVHTNKMENPVI